MSPRVQRTLYRLLALFLAAGAGDALVQFATADSYDVRHLVGALGAAAVMAAEKYLSESNTEIAAPTVEAVNLMQQTQAPSVVPPSISVPRPVLTVTDPNVPPPGV